MAEKAEKVEKDDKIDENVTDGEVEGEAEEGKGTGSNQNKKQTYTYEELVAENKRIVAKEKAAWKRRQDELLAGKDEEIESLKSDSGKKDELLKEQVDFLMGDLKVDEITKKVLEKMDVLEQFTLLREIATKQGKKEMPRPVKGQKKEEAFHSSFNAGL